MIDDSSAADFQYWLNKTEWPGFLLFLKMYPSFDGFALASSWGTPIFRNIALDNSLAVLNNAICNTGG